MLRKLLDRMLSILYSFNSVIVLTLLVAFYYGFIAADRYVSESILSVKATTQSTGEVNGLVSLLNTGSLSNEDIVFLKSYIHSLDMLKILEEKINIRALYEKQKIDIFYNVSLQAKQEGLLRYYQNRVKIFQDSDGILQIGVEGFDAQSAHLIASMIVKESERFINEISHRAAREQMAFAEKELLQFKERYQIAKENLLAFQNANGVFDPLKQAEGRLSLIGSLEGSIAAKEAEFLVMQSYMNETAPQIVTIKAEIEALKQQLQIEKDKIASLEASQRLNDLAARFQDLSIEVTFAENAYTTALKAFETARIEALRKIKQVVVIQSPSLPQSAKYPRRLYNILTFFMVFSLIFGIAKFIGMVIEEHRY